MAVYDYKSEVQHIGYLDVLPATQTNVTYRATMQEIVRKMQADTALLHPNNSIKRKS